MLTSRARSILALGLAVVMTAGGSLRAGEGSAGQGAEPENQLASASVGNRIGYAEARVTHGASAVASIDAALRAGQADRALQLIEDFRLEIDDADRRLLSGRAFIQLAAPRRACREFKAALRARPNDAGVHYWLARAYLDNHSAALATRHLSKAYWQGLDSAELHHDWARALVQSRTLLGQIAQRPVSDGGSGPFRAGTFAHGGVVVRQVQSGGQAYIIAPDDSALFQIHKALALDPDRGESLLLCAEIWAAINEHGLALDRFAQAADHLSEELLARCHRGWAASVLALGDVEAYLQHVRLAMEAAGRIDTVRYADAHWEAAREVARRGDLQRQIRYLTLSVEMRSDVDRLIELSDALKMARQYRDADRYLIRALDASPDKRQRTRIHERRSDLSVMLPASP